MGRRLTRTCVYRGRDKPRPYEEDCVDVVWHYYEDVLDYVREAGGEVVPGLVDDVSSGSQGYLAVVDPA